ncbi:MAG TPA: hypothetical protein VFF52_22005 [Isosphaeraceae bacterium]|nr:hypothetical protein [Isosphaeraceae bacterium]
MKKKPGIVIDSDEFAHDLSRSPSSPHRGLDLGIPEDPGIRASSRLLRNPILAT